MMKVDDMNWPNQNNDWPTGPAPDLNDAAHAQPDPSEVKSLNPLDAMSEDDLLMLWDSRKKSIEQAKESEMELRKYIVSRAFPNKKEGMNNKDLGNGYTLKAGVKYNYNLADNDTVEKCLDEIAKIGNQGGFIADRLVSWQPSFLITEYRALQEEKDKGDRTAIEILSVINEMLTITESAPTLEIKAPKAKKGK